ncbi:MAG: epoxide hydrolase [Alphaproteobacteria bacterium]
MTATPEPFQLHVADGDIADLGERLARTRFPDRAPVEPWSAGSEVDYVRELVGYWKDRFDWRAAEAKLNAFAQFKVPMDDVDLHFLHVPGNGPNPIPLLLLHGWPGSVMEFMDIIPRLTDPASFGGDAADAVTVVAPSLPGYGLSFTPGQKRFGVEDMAPVLSTLMTEVLGYDRYALQGGDWGSFVTSVMAALYPEQVIGLHLNMLPLRRDPKMLENPNEEEQRYLAQLNHFIKEETGYQAIQGTKPQTLAHGLTDSPAGLAAWIVEKCRTWTDCGGDVETALTKDQMLANIALYWFTGAIGSSFWPYYARLHGPWPIPDGKTIDVPTGHASLPSEILLPPRSLAGRTYTDIRRWTVMEKGGHFAAWEQPAALADDVLAFLRPLRG